MQSIKGIGSAVAQKLAKLRIFTVEDLLTHYPRRYEDRSITRKIAEMKDGESATLHVSVVRSKLDYMQGKSRVQVWVKDETGQAILTWFNQPYRFHSYPNGKPLRVFGRASLYRDRLQFDNPEVERLTETPSLNTDRIVPVYALTEGLSSRALRKIIAQALELPVALTETLPDLLRQHFGLIDRTEALREIHFPTDWSRMKQAKRRIVFEELLVFQCSLAYLRTQRQQQAKSFCHASDGSKISQFLVHLPFALTDDQCKAYAEIGRDMESERPMHRLLQGDVGSGKTAVALMALVKTVENGLQGLLMAPTEILAQQHYQSCQELLSALGIRSAILTGRVKGNPRELLLRQISAGEIDIVFGTHALLQPDVVFKNVGLVVVDEQHRFGVNQRSILSRKGDAPHLLVMSATPIPRSLALTIYGDLDLTTIRQLPPGRKPIVTVVRSGPQARERVYQHLKKEVSIGKQGYVVCPLIDDSEKSAAQSAVAIFDELTKSVLAGVSCGLLHGRLSSDEKEKMMSRFLAGEVSVLVATTVIEVGINVPKATMMIVEDAERFGLAQLHQLRGRVGRGSDRSYCVLIHGNSESSVPQRLRVMEQNSDGFAVAEYDLLLRGPGQFFGYRQHGLPELKMADIADDASVVAEVHEAVNQWMRDHEHAEMLKPYFESKIRQYFEFVFAG